MDADAASVRDAFARARQMYVDKVPLKDIYAATGLDDHDLDFALRGGPYVAPGERMFAEIKRNRIVRRQADRKKKPAAATRAAVVARLWRSAERQVRDIDKRLRQAGVEPAARERDARLMAVMVKTLRELCALDARDATNAKAGAHDGQPGYEPDHRDIDEFRRDLSRRIDAIISERAGPPADGTAGA